MLQLSLRFGSGYDLDPIGMNRFVFLNKQKIPDVQCENGETLHETVNGSCSNAIDTGKLIETGKTPTNARQKETYQKMIERVQEYHSKLDVSEYKGQGKVDLFVCCICFNIFLQHEMLRSHYMKVSLNYLLKFYPKKCIF